MSYGHNLISEQNTVEINQTDADWFEFLRGLYCSVDRVDSKITFQTVLTFFLRCSVRLVIRDL